MKREDAVGESCFFFSFSAQLLQIVQTENCCRRWELPCKEWAPSPLCVLSYMVGALNFALAGCLQFFQGCGVKGCGHPDSMKSADQWEQSQLVICWQIRQATMPLGPMGNNCLDALMWCASCDKDFFWAFKPRDWTGRLSVKKQGHAGPKPRVRWELLKTCSSNTVQCGLLLFR